MIFWRHKNPADGSWVYYPTKQTALKAIGKLALKHCSRSNQRVFFIESLELNRVDVMHFDGKHAAAKLMNKIERGESIKWLR